MAGEQLRLKCRLVEGAAEQNVDQWSLDDATRVLSIRRVALSIQPSELTLSKLLLSLEILFAPDLREIDDITERRARLWATAKQGDDYALLECDKDLADILTYVKVDAPLLIDLQLLPKEDSYPVGTHGVSYEDTADGPYPIKPNGQHVSTPTGAGLTDNHLQCDVFVAGAGSAGMAAALAAARSGATVVCVHGRPVIGGNASSEVKLNMVGANLNGNRGVELETEAREGGILEEIRLDNSICNPQWCAEMLDLTFLDKFRALPNMTLLLNTWFTGVNMDNNGSITTATADNQLTQQRYIVSAKVFIDTTGDGRLGAESGCKWRQGREAQSEFNESLAMLTADTATEGTSLAFTAEEKQTAMPFNLPPTFTRRFTKDDFKYRKPKELDYGFWWVEMSWPWNTVSDGEHITGELLEALLAVWDYMKNGAGGDTSSNPTNWALSWFGTYPCKREARRLEGMYIQTQNDIVPTPKLFSDIVSHGGWGLDLHNPKGINDTANPPYSSTHVPYLYGTPLRCFVSGNVPNLMMAGRLSSFSHVAFGSQRVMATCTTHGQAAGTAAAYAVQHGMTPQEVANSPEAVWSIQQQLLRDDQFVIGQINQDPRDKALTAKVTASSFQDGSPPNAAISGQTRAVFGAGGCFSGQCLPGTNRWISNGLPAQLSLEFKEPITIGMVELVFDSALHRCLTFTMKKGNRDKQVWGRPQPETVRDYVIDGLPAGAEKWETIINESGNYQRKRVHSVNDNRKLTALRITVTATNGIPDARICEIRVYEVGDGGKFPEKPKGLQRHPLLLPYDDNNALPTEATKSACALRLAAPPEPKWWQASCDFAA